MNKQTFKKEVLDWLKENGIVPKKVRVFDTKRYGLEVRCYTEPMEYVSTRISFRMVSKDDKQKYGTRGHHTIRQAMYVHINEEDFYRKPEEKKFALQVFKDSF